MEREKKNQRSSALTRRRALSDTQRTAFSAAICQTLATLDALQDAHVILSYRATEEETDLTAFHRWALERGKRLAFPVSYGQGRMEAWEPHGAECWERGRYGIWAPVPERSEPVRPEELDAVLLPCVAFDCQGRRLGHGGGYYDRYLPLCPKAKRILVAFETQRVEAVATDAHDQNAHVIVTELGCFGLELPLQNCTTGGKGQ